MASSCVAWTDTSQKHNVRTMQVQEEKEKHDKFHVPDSIEWVQLCDDKFKTCFWNRRTRTTEWKPHLGIRVVWHEGLGERGGRASLLAQGRPCQLF